ncbi:MAG: esterase [Ruminococcus sp.]|nr:esterase [Ruminococcus sp.]
MKTETLNIAGRLCTVYTDPEPGFLLIQPADAREFEHLEREIELIKSLTAVPFAFAAFEITDWNSELSPWTAPPVFGSEPFGSGAAETLAFAETALLPKLTERLSLSKGTPVILGGYSLAALFALWAGYASGRFAAAAAASPSVWFPGWLDFIGEHTPAAKNIYLSLGLKEEKTRNQTMATVGDNIRRQYEVLRSQDVTCTLEWNEGNHFTVPALRTAKGFAWCIEALMNRI